MHGHFKNIDFKRHKVKKYRILAVKMSTVSFSFPQNLINFTHRFSNVLCRKYRI